MAMELDLLKFLSNEIVHEKMGYRKVPFYGFLKQLTEVTFPMDLARSDT